MLYLKISREVAGTCVVPLKRCSTTFAASDFQLFI